MICSNCDNENEKEFKYCSSCGKFIKDDNEDEEEYLKERLPEAGDDELHNLSKNKTYKYPYEKKLKYITKRMNESKIGYIKLLAGLAIFWGLTGSIEHFESSFDLAVRLNTIFVLIIFILCRDNKEWDLKYKVFWFVGNVLSKALVTWLIYNYLPGFYHAHPVLIHIATGIPGVLHGYYSDKDNFRTVEVRVIDREDKQREALLSE